jgi:hypothetical protein
LILGERRGEHIGCIRVGQPDADNWITLVLPEQRLGRFDRQEDDIAIIAFVADMVDRRDRERA